MSGLPLRAILFDRDDATSVHDALVKEGYTAEIARERYAGEDNDEDHPWAVLTDAPLITVELLVDRYDGWLETDVP